MTDATGSVPGAQSEPGQTGEWVLPGYRHERVLGSGATGRVVLARHAETGTPVAIKYLIKNSALAPALGDTFANEARLLADLRSENVARLYEYVESPEGSAIVMELVEGVTLRTLLREEGATTPEAALSVLKGSLLGLAAAHEAGVVHRDYKPENVLVTPEGVSKLVDFGLATRFGTSPKAAGTPVYMAPEQFTGGPASAPADVYAATATFFECVTGARPYSGTTAVELMVQHSEAPIPDELAPEPLRPLVRAGLAKTPEERPASAAELVAQLEVVARGAYGEDWEERGQRKLAALTAMLPLLLLEGKPPAPPASTTDFAVTNLGPASPVRALLRKKAAGPVAVTAAIIAIVLIIVATRGNSDAAGDTALGATAGTTVTGTPTATDGGPAPIAPIPAATTGATTAGTPTPSGTTTTAAQDATWSAPTQQPTGGKPTVPHPPTVLPPTQQPPGPKPTATTTQPVPPPPHPTTPTPTPTTPAPVLHVRSITITSAGCFGRTGMIARTTVVTDGAASGTEYFSWFYVNANGAHVAWGSTTTQALQAGQTSFDTYSSQDFGAAPSSTWGVTVTTKPAADSGNGASTTIFGTNCEIQ